MKFSCAKRIEREGGEREIFRFYCLCHNCRLPKCERGAKVGTLGGRVEEPKIPKRNVCVNNVPSVPRFFIRDQMLLENSPKFCHIFYQNIFEILLILSGNIEYA